MPFLVGKGVEGKEHRGWIPALLAFCVTSAVEGSGDSQLGRCHVACVTSCDSPLVL